MNYLEWNEAIGRHFFNSGRADERIYLIVEPQTLADVATAPFPTSEDAQKAFVAQVCRQIVRQGWKVGHLGRDCYPSFMGLLAFQVLAAYLMQASEDWTAAAYWPQVRKLLDQEQISRMPPGLNGETHQSMWRSLEVWANNEPYQGGGWGVVCLPQDRTGPHCHIRLPLSQTLLRQEGLSRLPAFFEEVGFRAGEELDSEEVWEEVSTRLDNPKFLTRHGRRVQPGAFGQGLCRPVPPD